MKFAGEMQKWDPTLPNAARNKDRSRFHLMPEIKILAEIKEIAFSSDARNKILGRNKGDHVFTNPRYENVAKNKTDHIFTRYREIDVVRYLIDRVFTVCQR